MKLGTILLMGLFSGAALAQTQPVRRTVTTAGAVKKPGIYSMRETGLTLLQVIGMSGGLLPTANLSEIQVVRLKQQGADNNSSETITLDLLKTMSGKAPDFQLQPGDVIVVPSALVRPDAPIRLKSPTASL